MSQMARRPPARHA